MGLSFINSNNGGLKAGVPTNYYISAGGNDSNDGLSPATSITTTKIPSLSLNTLDVLNFNRGDTYVFGDMPQTISALKITPYGSGAKPKFYGSKDLSAVTWTAEGGGIYSTVLAYTPLWVYVNGSVANVASTPLVTISTVSSNVITATSIIPISGYAGSFVGAKLRSKITNWIVSDEYTVTAYNAGAKTITVDRAYVPGLNQNAHNIWMYMQQQFLTSGTWFFDINTSKLYIYSTTSPSGTDIRAGFYNTFIANKMQLTMDNIELLNYQTNVITYGPWSNIDNNIIHDCRGTGMFGNFSDHSRITNNTVHHCDLNGIFSFRGLNSYYINNTIYDITTGTTDQTLGYPTNSDNLEVGLAGYPLSVTGQEFMAYCLTSMQEDGSVITKNNIYNIGYVGIHLTSSGSNTLVDKNYVHDHIGTILSDGALIYSEGQIVFTNNGGTISNNILENGGSNLLLAGIYIDNFSQNMKIINNSVYKGGAYCSMVFNSGTRNHTITGNKIVGEGSLQGGYRFVESGGFPWALSGCIFTNNQSAMTFTYGCMVIGQAFNPFSGGGSSDNNVYVFPYDNTNIIKRNSVAYNSSTWPAILGTDASSTYRTNYITYSNSSNANQEVKMERNPSDTPESFNVPAGYSDVNGNPFSNPVTINPWSSLIYLKDTAFP